ncbi:MRC1-like domain-containing protein [Diplogelasinospora grovesii]|uniref:MRC1-like domain-containing protein n=1 Tax=Diplogelasinospora grovesii TaxID=303347 RepID=A0AAN6S6K0_9PEZI|nr:MRC1-like domain-containing protein [Diplogelasinospora grovesii]
MAATLSLALMVAWWCCCLNTQGTMPSSRSSPSPSEGARSESDIEQLLSQQLSADIKLHGAKVSFSDDDSEEDSDDQDILKPRGKLAARMHAKTADSQDDEEDEVLPTRRKLQPRKRSTTPNSPDRPRAGTPEEEDDLFVTPSKPQPTATATADSDSDDGLPNMSKLGKNSRFAALVEKKRKEREAREAAEARKQAERAERLATQLAEDDNDILSGDDSSNVTDDDGGRKLTQEVTKRPSARKASKKALEEMNRETQRLTRSLQLAHEAKTKKKITKAALFERFNFKPAGSGNEVAHSSSRPATPASVHHQSDVDAEMKEADQESDTPPSSPPVPGDAQNVEKQQQTEDEPLSLEDLAAAPKKEKADKGKGKATAEDLKRFELEEQQQVQQQTKSKRKLRVVKLPQTTTPQSNHVQVDLDGDDDDDLVVEPTRKSRIDAIFDRVPVNAAREPRPLHMLRRLAHVDDPEKKVGAAPIGGPKAAKFRKEQPQQLMTVGELQLSLMQKAKLQAKMERDRHLEMLRSKGIHVQTAEEREKEMELVEDIVAKARKEAEDIMQREREDAKADRKARRDAGEEDPLAWDDSEDDDDYQDPVEVEEKEVELSGSEEEEEVDEDMNEEGEEEEEEEEEEEAGVLIDGAAQSADESDGEAEEAEDGLPPPAQSSPEHNSDEEEEEELPTASKVVRRRRSRKTKTVTILSDDDDDEDEDEGVRVEATPLKKTVEATPRPKNPFQQHPPKSGGLNSSPKIPTSVLRSATKPFIPGLPVAGPAGLGLTQIFQGTMDSQEDGSPAGFKSPMPSFDDPIFPDSQFSQTAGEVVMDSQRQSKETQGETQGISQLKFNQSQAHGFDTFLVDNTQASELYKPTQDEGFRDYSPLKERFIELPQSTVSTVPLNETQEEGDSHSPLVQRTGRLRRRADLLQTVGEYEDEHMSDGEGEGGELEGDEFGFGTVPSTNNNTAFNVMKEAARKEKQRKKMEEFDKKKSKAREMIEEQAEESEDEFAGLGGADGEDSDDDSDSHSVKEMIDDETKNTEGDDRKLAAYYAYVPLTLLFFLLVGSVLTVGSDRERASDEKQVEKLFRDITSGMLRRKRNRDGGDFDLSDSDDGGEARRRMKRRQFQKMQRALFTDERISKVASNPRNSAFLRSIEDRGSDDDDEMDFILPTAPAAPTAVIPNSQPDTNTGVSAGTNPRRTTKNNGKKPANLGEIRESLSNLLDEPHTSSVIPATELGSDDDSENDDEPSSSSNKENQPNTGSNPRRTTGSGGGVAVVDRLTLKRNSSSSSMSRSGKLAFANPAAANSSGAANNGGFKVPGLLRRATTNSSLISNPSNNNNNTTTSSTGATTYNESRKSGGGGVEGGGGGVIKKSAGKKSGISYLARENERRAAVAESERRREVKKWKGAENRVKVVGGLFGGGKFE